VTRILPKQKNHAFYTKEPNAFKNLKKLNSIRRSDFELRRNENELLKKNSEDFLNDYLKNFGLKKLQSFKQSLKKEEEQMIIDTKEKDLKYVQEFFKLKEKSSK